VWTDGWTRWLQYSPHLWVGDILYYIIYKSKILAVNWSSGGRRGRDRMVVRFTTTYAISAYQHWCCRVRISIRVRCTLCDKVCQWLVIGLRFSPGPPVSSTNKTDRHDIVESGVKHHQTNKLILLNQMLYLLTFYFET
jgi:hypothetical protein